MQPRIVTGLGAWFAVIGLLLFGGVTSFVAFKGWPGGQVAGSGESGQVALATPERGLPSRVQPRNVVLGGAGAVKRSGKPRAARHRGTGPTPARSAPRPQRPATSSPVVPVGGRPQRPARIPAPQGAAAPAAPAPAASTPSKPAPTPAPLIELPRPVQEVVSHTTTPVTDLVSRTTAPVTQIVNGLLPPR